MAESLSLIMLRTVAKIVGFQNPLERGLPAKKDNAFFLPNRGE
jgi:hypothetical protein